jgi:hypothetical protein
MLMIRVPQLFFLRSQFARQGGAEKTTKTTLKFTLDCQQPADDNIIETKDDYVLVNLRMTGFNMF